MLSVYGMCQCQYFQFRGSTKSAGTARYSQVKPGAVGPGTARYSQVRLGRARCSQAWSQKFISVPRPSIYDWSPRKSRQMEPTTIAQKSPVLLQNKSNFLVGGQKKVKLGEPNTVLVPPNPKLEGPNMCLILTNRTWGAKHGFDPHKQNLRGPITVLRGSNIMLRPPYFNFPIYLGL